MQNFLKHKRYATILWVLVAVFISGPLLAESAPVYDADSLQQQFENAPSDNGLSEWPPAPGQESKAFVPASPSSASSSPRLVRTPEGAMEPRLKRVEQQIQNMQNDGTAEKINALQTQVQTLRGQVEQLTHDLQQATSQQKSMYTDLDKRVMELKLNPTKVPSTMESTLAAPKPMRSSSKTTVKMDGELNNSRLADKKISAQPDIAEEQQIYQTAYNLIKAKKYEEAVTTLQLMLKKYPSGQFASNAHYWLGELYGLLSKNELALAEFNIIVTQYTDSPRLSDAQLKIGLIYAAQSKWPEAKTVFKKVINRYPGTTSARLAAQHLAQMKQAGN